MTALEIKEINKAMRMVVSVAAIDCGCVNFNATS